MTDQTGPRRHPAGYYKSEAIPVPAYLGDPATVPGEPVWTTHRTLDPVRGAALTAAVELVARLAVKSNDDGEFPIGHYIRCTFALAEEFERYLTGEEADGQD